MTRHRVVNINVLLAVMLCVMLRLCASGADTPHQQGSGEQAQITVGTQPSRPATKTPAGPVSVVLKSVIFTSDHGVLRKYTWDFEGDGTPDQKYDPRGWVKGGANNPVSHTMDQNVSVNVTVCAKPNGARVYIRGKNATVPGLSFDARSFTATGQDQAFNLTSSTKLLHMVDVLKENVAWEIGGAGVSWSSIGNSGPHNIYVTCGNPGTGPTKKRINYVCTTAINLGNATRIDNAIWDATPDTFPWFGGLTPGFGWDVKDGEAAECIGLAQCMVVSLQMLGLTAQLQKVRASTNAGAGKCLDLEYRTCPVHGREALALMFGPIVNNCEGCCSADGGYYAIHPKKHASDDYAMLQKLGTEEHVRQFWCLVDAWDIPSCFPCNQSGAEVPIP